jgi:hypothetical protein
MGVRMGGLVDRAGSWWWKLLLLVVCFVRLLLWYTVFVLGSGGLGGGRGVEDRDMVAWELKGIVSLLLLKCHTVGGL